MRVEMRRFEILNPTNPRTEDGYAEFFGVLDRIREKAGGGLVVVVMPDEFQVNDALFEELWSRTGQSANYDRLLPQKRIHEYCRAHNVACVDPLEALRTAQAEDRVYRLRDTHLNARGNAIVGELLGKTLSKAVH